MLITCWSAKAGVGTSVVAAALAFVMADRHPSGSLLVDVVGDQPAVLGLPAVGSPGWSAWLEAGDDAPEQGLRRLEVELRAGVHLLPRGERAVDDPELSRLADALESDARPVVVDVGLVSSRQSMHAGLARRGTPSVLVVRPCYLALRAAVDAPVRPDGVIVVDEPDRALGPTDVEQVVGVPVLAVVRADPAVARAVDAGLLGQRIPRSLARPLAGVA